MSHWGRTSSLVAKLTSTGQPSHRGSWKSGSIREGCNDCSQNRQGNITAIQSDKPTTSKNQPAWLTITAKSPMQRVIMKTTPVLQPVIMFLPSLNKVSSSSSSLSLSLSLLSYFSLLQFFKHHYFIFFTLHFLPSDIHGGFLCFLWRLLDITLRWNYIGNLPTLAEENNSQVCTCL